jgi:hypothetical protein
MKRMYSALEIVRLIYPGWTNMCGIHKFFSVYTCISLGVYVLFVVCAVALWALSSSVSNLLFAVLMSILFCIFLVFLYSDVLARRGRQEVIDDYEFGDFHAFYILLKIIKRLRRHDRRLFYLDADPPVAITQLCSNVARAQTDLVDRIRKERGSTKGIHLEKILGLINDLATNLSQHRPTDEDPWP